jgi:hypothetical protein
MHDAQAKVILEGVEVAVVVQQLVAFLDTKSCDDAIDGLAHG